MGLLFSQTGGCRLVGKGLSEIFAQLQRVLNRHVLSQYVAMAVKAAGVARMEVVGGSSRFFRSSSSC